MGGDANQTEVKSGFRIEAIAEKQTKFAANSVNSNRATATVSRPIEEPNGEQLAKGGMMSGKVLERKIKRKELEFSLELMEKEDELNQNIEKLKNEFQEWKQSRESTLKERKREIELENKRTENRQEPEQVLEPIAGTSRSPSDHSGEDSDVLLDEDDSDVEIDGGKRKKQQFYVSDRTLDGNTFDVTTFQNKKKKKDGELILINGLELNEAEKRICPGLEVVGRKKSNLMVKCNVCNDNKPRLKANAISHYITNHTGK